MRILIVSDIHSNIVALEAVLAAAGSYDALWCLGDTIGYGPSPNECVAAIMARADVSISGNHDLACLGKVDLSDFNPDARKANIWNGKQLNSTHHTWLDQLEAKQQIDERFTVAHGSPREPVWEYLLMPVQALENAPFFATQVCFIGHSHVQMGFRLGPNSACERFLPENGQVITLNDDLRFFINPGSVAQPRDHDPRAAYATLDNEAGTISFHRISYDIGKTQRQMKEVGLPSALIRRLEFGL
ncbi:MAG: metallophosphatase family protein [Chloroflexales bacterium]|nr:metallophosphatase family protein [Chloroflexales bacterium]